MPHNNEPTLALTGTAGPIYSSQQSLIGKPDVIGWQRGQLSVQLIDRETAVRIIRANHYSKKVAHASRYHFGIFNETELVGIAQYGYAMNPASQESVVANTRMDEYLELNRLWVDDCMPRNTESAALALTLKWIRNTTPVAWVQSFADERCRRFGAIYQACSFDYVGEHMATFWELDGIWYHNSLMTRKTYRPPAAQTIQNNRHRAIEHRLRQFRYIKFLRKSFRKNLLLPIQPYPKPGTIID